MMDKTIRMTLTTDPAITCKDRWHFVLERDGAEDYRIVKLEISGDRGCEGHPKTIAALMQNRRVTEIDDEALHGVECSRDQSCGRTFALLVRELRRSLGMSI